MRPKSLINLLRRVVSKHVQAIPASGMFLNGNITFLHCSDHNINKIFQELMMTEFKKYFLLSLNGLPIQPGLKRFDLYFGVSIQYLCLDHLFETQAGVFVVDCINSNLEEYIRNMALSTSRKKKEAAPSNRKVNYFMEQPLFQFTFHSD